MAVSFRNITFDCSDARALGGFWAEFTGWNLYYDDDPEVVVAPSFPATTRPGLLFIPVPEGKTSKNRVHLDVTPTDRTRDEAVAHAVELGATVLADFRGEKDTGWVVLADPEGNEFCIERSEAERGPAGGRAFRVTS